MRNDKRLKIHIEEEPKVETVAERLHQQLPIAKQICEQFEALTGWVVQYDLSESAYQKLTPETGSLWGQFEITDLSESIGPGKTAIHRGKSEEFLQSMNWFVKQLKENQSEIELGGDGFRFFDFQSTPNKSDVLSTQLVSVAKSLKAEAAALYLLDDETTQLRIRACVGGNQKPKQLAATRPLEHSLADLEALVGNVVQINRQDLSPAWNLPEPYENGACITVGSDGMPLGTMWVFFEKQCQLTPQEIGMLETVAQQIGTELVSRKKPDQQQTQVPQIEQDIRNASRINDSRLPHFSPEIDGWKIAGWTYRKDKLTGNFHDWSMTPSGGLSISLGQVSGSSVPAAINANNLRSLICAHRDYRHDAKKMVEKLNENIWTNSPGDELASLIYTLVDPETGLVQISNAGDGGVVLLDGEKPRSIDQFQDPLGLDMESDYLQWEGTLDDSQSIILFSQGLRTAFCELTSAVDDADLFGKIFEDCSNEPDLILAAIQDLFFQSDFQTDAPDLSVIVLSKKQPPQAQYYYGRAEETVGVEGARGSLAAGDPEVEKSFNAFIEAISVGNVEWVQGEEPSKDNRSSEDESPNPPKRKSDKPLDSDAANGMEVPPVDPGSDQGGSKEKEDQKKVEQKKAAPKKPAKKVTKKQAVARKSSTKSVTKKAPKKSVKKRVAKKKEAESKLNSTTKPSKKRVTKKSAQKKSASTSRATKTVTAKKASTKKADAKKPSAKKTTLKKAAKKTVRKKSTSTTVAKKAETPAKKTRKKSTTIQKPKTKRVSTRKPQLAKAKASTSSDSAPSAKKKSTRKKTSKKRAGGAKKSGSSKS